jgi:hypothetical protein
MKPDSPLLGLQDSTTGPIPVPDESSPRPQIIRYILILSNFCLCLPSGLFSLSFLTKTFYTVLFALMRAKNSSHLILHDLFILITSGEEYKS